jgi:hypothetical protein
VLLHVARMDIPLSSECSAECAPGRSQEPARAAPRGAPPRGPTRTIALASDA